MKVGYFVKRTWRKYAGDAKYPQPGDERWQFIVDLGNDAKNDWATDPNNLWKSLLEPNERTIGTLSSSKNYDLDDDIIGLSDWVYVDALDGQRYRFGVTKAANRTIKPQTVYLTGQDPKILNFSDDIPTKLIGGTIRALCYALPDDMVNADDTVPVDRPGWLALAVAAELARNDPAKEDQFPDIIGQANDEYAKMIDANNSLPNNQEDEVPVAGFNEDCAEEY